MPPVFFFGFLAIVVSIIIFVFQRKTKSLCYAITANMPLVNSDDDIDNGISLIRNGEIIDKARIISLVIKNNGNKYISKDDYTGDISFYVSNVSSVIFAKIIDSNPSDIFIKNSSEIKIHHDSFFIEPLLLNPGDSLTIKLITQGGDGEADVSIAARIAGVREIKKTSQGKIENRNIDLIVASVLSVFPIAYFYLASISINEFFNDAPYRLTTWIEAMRDIIKFLLVLGICLFTYSHYEKIRKIILNK